MFSVYFSSSLLFTVSCNRSYFDLKYAVLRALIEFIFSVQASLDQLVLNNTKMFILLFSILYDSVSHAFLGFYGTICVSNISMDCVNDRPLLLDSCNLLCTSRTSLIKKIDLEIPVLFAAGDFLRRNYRNPSAPFHVPSRRTRMSNDTHKLIGDSSMLI